MTQDEINAVKKAAEKMRKQESAQDEIIEMAIKAGLAFDSEEYPEIWIPYMNVGKKEIQAFVKLVADKEREACAKTLESISNAPDIQAYANAIRARGEQA